MKNCNYKNAIVIGADTTSQILDWEDRSTAVLFGDGAGAVVLSNTQAATIPIALHEALEKKLINRGDIILFAAFGAGLSSGAVLLKW